MNVLQRLNSSDISYELQTECYGHNFHQSIIRQRGFCHVYWELKKKKMSDSGLGLSLLVSNRRRHHSLHKPTKNLI